MNSLGQHVPLVRPAAKHRGWFAQCASAVGDLVGEIDGLALGDCDASPHGRSCPATRSAYAPPDPHAAPPAQSPSPAHPPPAAHRAEHTAPPQSTPVSSPFWTPSLHLRAGVGDDGHIVGAAE